MRIGSRFFPQMHQERALFSSMVRLCPSHLLGQVYQRHLGICNHQCEYFFFFFYEQVRMLLAVLIRSVFFKLDILFAHIHIYIYIHMQYVCVCVYIYIYIYSVRLCWIYVLLFYRNPLSSFFLFYQFQRPL